MHFWERQWKTDCRTGNEIIDREQIDRFYWKSNLINRFIVSNKVKSNQPCDMLFSKKKQISSFKIICDRRLHWCKWVAVNSLILKGMSCVHHVSVYLVRLLFALFVSKILSVIGLLFLKRSTNFFSKCLIGKMPRRLISLNVISSEGIKWSWIVECYTNRTLIWIVPCKVFEYYLLKTHFHRIGMQTLDVDVHCYFVVFASFFLLDVRACSRNIWEVETGTVV